MRDQRVEFVVGASRGEGLSSLCREYEIGHQVVCVDKNESKVKTLRGKRMAALGPTFKGNIDDIRDSPATRRRRS